MAAENIIERSFAGGEITPAMYARVDQSKYQTGLRTLRNRIVMRHGGATQRPGTMFVASTLNGGNPVRLIPFIYNETGLGQSYVLEFGNQYIAFYQNGGVVISGGNPYTISSPYVQADLASLKFDQCADIMTIVHPSYPPKELSRSGPTNWALNGITFGVHADNGANTIITSGGGSGSFNFIYLVTGVDLNGNESPASGFTGAATGINQPSPTNPVTVSWQGPVGIPISQIAYWRIYRANWVGGGAVSTFGYVGTVPATPKIFVDVIDTADFTNTPPNTSPFESLMGPGYYPSVVSFVQQRRVFSNWLNNPIGFAMSKPGSFYNFDVHTNGSPDDDPIFGTIAGTEVNAIQHILELKFCLMLTAGAEIYTQGNGSGVVTPSAINNATQSYYGSSSLKPIRCGDVLLFNQALGSFIRDFVFDFVIDGYRGNDITLFSSHLFEGYQIVDWAYQKVPDSIIWAVRSDGVLLSCTYLREQQVLAWARHDFTDGAVENVCCIPENGEYAVYLSIHRTINDTAVRYIERMSSRLWPNLSSGEVAAQTANAIGDPIDATYLDSYSNFDGRNSDIFHTMYVNPASITIISGVNDGIDFQSSTSGGAVFATVPAGSYDQLNFSHVLAAAMHAVDPGTAYTGGITNLGGGLFAQTMTGSFLFSMLFGTGAHVSRSCGPVSGWGSVDLTGSTSFSASTGLATPAFKTDGTAYQQNLILVSSSSYFGLGYTAQVGDQIFMQDALWVSSQGTKGNQTKLTIQSIMSPTLATVTPEGSMPTEFKNLAQTIIWARAVKTISGLNYLYGRQVSIWADRYVVGSPLNYNVEQIYTVPISGVLTLDKCYSVIYVGLPMVADLETLAIDTTFGDSMLGETKNISEVIVYLYNTRGFFGGTRNPDTDPDNIVNGVVQNPLFNLTENKAQANRQTYNAPPSLITGAAFTSVNCNWSEEGRIFVRNVDPIPSTILAVVPAGLTSAKIPYSQRV